jgi:hypothetical protein
MRFISEARNGKLVSEYDVHPDTLQHYYANDTTVSRRASNRTGAGHPPGEGSDSDSGEDEADVEMDVGTDMETDVETDVETDKADEEDEEDEADEEETDEDKAVTEDEDEVMGMDGSDEATEAELDQGTLRGQITDDVQFNINHPAVKVPRSQSPFTNPTRKALFLAVLNQICTAGAIPHGYGITAAEWGEGGYPTYETITVGRRAQQLIVELPETIWLP